MKACEIVLNPQDVETLVLLLCWLGGVGFKSPSDITKRACGNVTNDLTSVYGMKMNSNLLSLVRGS